MVAPLIIGVITAGTWFVFIEYFISPYNPRINVSPTDGSDMEGTSVPDSNNTENSILGGSTVALGIDQLTGSAMNTNIVIVLLIIVGGILIWKYAKKKKFKSKYLKIGGDSQNYSRKKVPKKYRSKRIKKGTFLRKKGVAKFKVSRAKSKFYKKNKPSVMSRAKKKFSKKKGGK